jgi:hypothetical protein
VAQSGYVGKAGHLAAMAEFLLRRYNVAMPEVDVGDDIFVVEARTGRLWRIQVKTAIGKRRRYGYSGKFAVSLAQLNTLKTPDLFFVFVLRVGDRWEFVILPRETLKDLHEGPRIGNVAAGDLVLNFRLTATTLLCSGTDFRLTATTLLCSGTDLQAHRNNWIDWPLIRP